MHKRYVEFVCENPECPMEGESWEVYARLEASPDGDGGVEIIPVSDDPTGRVGSTACEGCGEEGSTL